MGQETGTIQLPENSASHSNQAVSKKFFFRNTFTQTAIVLTGSVMNSAIVMGNTLLFYTSAEDVSGQSQ